MRRVTFALVLALAAGSFATAVSAAPTAGAPPVPGKATKSKPSALQRAMRNCAKMTDETAKVTCQKRAQAQAKSSRKTTAARKPPPAPAPTPVSDTTN